ANFGVDQIADNHLPIHLIRNTIGNAIAAPSSVQRHHQARLRSAATPIVELHAERPMPTHRGGASNLDRRESWVPNERPVSENAKWSDFLALFDEPIDE